jgi:hypothetical protein
MQRVVVLFVALAVVGAAGEAAAQSAAISPADLAATWQLVSIEQGVSAGKPERIPQPRGLMILDSAATRSSGLVPRHAISPTLQTPTR